MADKIVADYIVKTDEAVKNLNRLEKEVKDLQNQGKKSANDIESNFKKTSSSLISQFSKVGAAIGVAFGAAELISFGKEAVNVAAKAEGIERAFNKLNNPNLLADLRKATRGTVSDLELMQKAVQANNFKLPLDQLAKLFKFATDRAIETGESVDYLVESIVLGISRKSIPILDNLGISSVQIQEEMRKTGDFAQAAFNIVEQSMADAGDVADTTAVKMAQLTAIFENFKVDVGNAIINQLDELSDGFAETSETIAKLTGDTDGFNIVMFVLNNTLSAIADPFKAANYLINQTAKGLNFAKEASISLSEELKEAAYRLTLNNEELAKFYKLSETGKKILVDQWLGIKDLTDIREEDYVQIVQTVGANKDLVESQEEVIKNLKFYNDLIAELQTKQKDANTTRAEVRQLEDEINEAIRQRLILLGRLREVGGASMQEIETIAASELDVQQQLTDDILADYAHRNGEIEAAQDKLNESLAKKAEEQRQMQADMALMITQQTLSSISSLVSSISQIQSTAFKKEQQELEEQLEQGLITREEFDEKTKAIRKKQAAAEKDAAIFQAVIGTAQAVMQALANTPPPASYALAAVAGALGAVQIAAIASEPLPQFAEGGWVDSKGKIHGRSHAQGGVKLEAEGDEFIVKGKVAKTNASLLEALNAGKGQEWINKNMVYPAIQNVIDSGVESNSGNWGNVTASLKDHNLIAAIDRDRSATVYGLNMVASKLDKLNKRNHRAGW